MLFSTFKIRTFVFLAMLVPGISSADSISNKLSQRSLGIGIGTVTGSYKDDDNDIALAGKSGMMINHTYVKDANLTLTLGVSGFQLKGETENQNAKKEIAYDVYFLDIGYGYALRFGFVIVEANLFAGVGPSTFSYRVSSKQGGTSVESPNRTGTAARVGIALPVFYEFWRKLYVAAYPFFQKTFDSMKYGDGTKAGLEVNSGAFIALGGSF